MMTTLVTTLTMAFVICLRPLIAFAGSPRGSTLKGVVSQTFSNDWHRLAIGTRSIVKWVSSSQRKRKSSASGEDAIAADTLWREQVALVEKANLSLQDSLRKSNEYCRSLEAAGMDSEERYKTALDRV